MMMAMPNRAEWQVLIAASDAQATIHFVVRRIPINLTDSCQAESPIIDGATHGLRFAQRHSSRKLAACLAPGLFNSVNKRRRGHQK
jgi:hypothetical protein